jgi:hypothetical protein
MIEKAIENPVVKPTEIAKTPIEEFWDKFDDSVEVPQTEQKRQEMRMEEFWKDFDNSVEVPKYMPEHPGKRQDELPGGLHELVYNELLSSYQERLKQTPAEGERGHWTGERGESEYIPNDDKIKEILSKYEIGGIEYRDAIPDFSKCSEAEVQIDNMSENRISKDGKEGNFEQADSKCAESWNAEARDGKTDWTARDVAEWRRDNNYCWHECNDRKTCQLVPTEVNAYFGHLGGVGECNKEGKKEVGFDE